MSWKQENIEQSMRTLVNDVRMIAINDSEITADLEKEIRLSVVGDLIYRLLGGKKVEITITYDSGSTESSVITKK